VRKTIAAAALSGLAATAAAASIPKEYSVSLPPARKSGEVTYLSGGNEQDEALALKRAAARFPLEVVFVEKTGKRERHIAHAAMPVRITDTEGRVMFEGESNGPYFLARLPKGRYTVSTRWDALVSSRPVTIGSERQRVVFAWVKTGDSPLV
jgi:hypothetical protein